MKTLSLSIIGCIILTVFAQAGTTITYTYDKQHRLTSVDYSAVQTDAHVAYQYDAANNLDVYVAITDGQYLRSFLWYFTWRTSPIWHPYGYAKPSWPEIWARLAAKS